MMYEAIKGMFENIVEMLSFLGALREYNTIDRIGNAIDESSIYSAIKDALRAFHSYCRDRKCVELDDKKIRCPSIEAEELDRDVEQLFKVLIANRDNKREIIKLAGELAARSYAKINKHLSTTCLEER